MTLNGPSSVPMEPRRVDPATQLVQAAERGDVKTVRQLSSQALPEDKGWALKKAAQNGQIAVVEELLASSALLEGDQEIAMLYAAKKGHRVILECFLAHQVVVSSEVLEEMVKDTTQDGRYDIAQLLLREAHTFLRVDTIRQALKERNFKLLKASLFMRHMGQDFAHLSCQLGLSLAGKLKNVNLDL